MRNCVIQCFCVRVVKRKMFLRRRGKWRESLEGLLPFLAGVKIFSALRLQMRIDFALGVAYHNNIRGS